MASSNYKKFNREIKGYVELQSKVKDKNICSFVSLLEGDSGILPIPNGNVFNVGNIINASIKKYNWAILRNNYTLLNGDYNLFNTIWKPYGFISNKKVNELSENAQIILDFNDKVDGITLFFQENPLKNASVYLYNESTLTNTLTIENNNDDTIYLDLSEEKFTQVIVEVTEWTNNELPIWIRSILLGYGYIYENDELIEFTTTEEVNKLVEETPSNELRVTIGDYKKLYDPLNPVGITKLLNKYDTTYTPYVGIIIEAGNVQYTSLGIYYFNNIEYNDLEVTITAYNLMEKLNKKLITNDTGNLTTESNIIPINGLSSYLDTYMTTEVQMPFDININNKIRMNTKALKRVSLSEFFQQISMIDGIFYIDRNDRIIIKNIDKTIKESITKQELLNDIKYTNVQKVTSFNLQRDIFTMEATDEANDTANFTSTFKLESETQFFCITSDNPTELSWLKNENLTVTGATSYNIITKTSRNEFNFMLFVKVIGNKGDEVTISGKYPYRKKYSMSTETELIGTGEPSMTINNPLYLIKYYAYDDMFTNFFKKAYSYKVSLEYNGNPTIKAGDYINVESNYGMIPIFVQKHTLTYNGGLNGSIEGVE